MRPVLFILLLILMSCSEKHSKVIYGQTTKTELLKVKGEPVKTESIPDARGEVLSFPDEEKFQLEDNLVKGAFRNPEGDEKLLLYWKHKFKDCNASERKINSEEKAHTPSEWELACPEQGQSVVFTEGTGIITRIYEYEKK